MESRLLDATGSVFFARQLEAVKAGTFDVQYADLPWRSLFPTSTGVHPGATSITYRTYDQTGTAAIINDYAQDLPRADVAGKETTHPVRTLASSFGYSQKEIKSSQMAGWPLDQKRSMAARRALEEKMNYITFNGDSATSLPGLLSNSDIPAGYVSVGGSGTATWATKTPDEILYDINYFGGLIYENSKGKERPNTLLLPLAQWSHIMATPRSGGSDMSIAKWITSNSPWITSLSSIVAVNEMASCGPDGAGDCFLLYDKSPSKLALEIVEDITFHPVQEKALSFVVPVTAEFGGLHVYYPLSLYLVEDI